MILMFSNVNIKLRVALVVSFLFFGFLLLYKQDLQSNEEILTTPLSDSQLASERNKQNGLSTTLSSGEIEFDDNQADLYKEIVSNLLRRHYKKQELDDKFSSDYLKTYLKMLDPGKNYFLKSDINSFQKWSDQLDDYSQSGFISPGSEIFNIFKYRYLTRLNKNISLLEDQSSTFNLDTNQTISYDIESKDWMSSTQEANEYWKRRLTDLLIRQFLNDEDENLEDAKEVLIKRFKNQLRLINQRDSQDIFQIYVNAFASLFDPHTSYFSPRTNENFQINMSLSLEGIGAELTTEDEYTKVNRVVPGGPADLHGALKAEDKIVGVGQENEEMVDVIGWRLDEVVELIRGAKDTIVRLEYIPSSTDLGGTKIISIVRDKVKLEDRAATSEIIQIENQDNSFSIGIIEIPAFYMDFDAYRAGDKNFKSTSGDVAEILKELKQSGVDGIVLDLRGNGGGALFEATSLADLFLDAYPFRPKTIVQIKDASSKIYMNKIRKPALYNGPLVVLIDRLSASASEIVAGALQDYQRALVLGSQSYGKGTVQDISPVTLGQVKQTVSKFYRVSGESTQSKGVVPDIALPSLINLEEVGENQKEYALVWDQISGVAPLPLPEKKALSVKRLENLHLERRIQDPNLKSIIERIELSKAISENDVFSLNLKERKDQSVNWDNALFSIENDRRLSIGEEIFDTVDEWKAFNDQLNSDDPDRPKSESDPLLFETSRILADYISLNERS